MEAIRSSETSVYRRLYGATSQKTAFFIVTAVTLQEARESDFQNIRSDLPEHLKLGTSVCYPSVYHPNLSYNEYKYSLRNCVCARFYFIPLGGTGVEQLARGSPVDRGGGEVME
jgi:hypothetical protein